MFRLSIITINYNNLEGLKKTVGSVLAQTSSRFEYIIIDGGSTDGSREFIEKTAGNESVVPVKWVSEKDNGIYHAMNKGIKKAEGKFVQFINSGDVLVDKDVTQKMLAATVEEDEIIYGNMLKTLPKGLFRDKGFAGRKPSMLDFYYGTLNHSPALIRRSLFERFGFYDESLRIVSDWKWYLQVIILSGIEIKYVPLDVTFFDMNGISNTNAQLEKNEREKVLKEFIPVNILSDYNRSAYGILFYDRIKKFRVGYSFFILFDRFYCWLERKMYNNYIKK